MDNSAYTVSEGAAADTRLMHSSVAENAEIPTIHLNLIHHSIPTFNATTPTPVGQMRGTNDSSLPLAPAPAVLLDITMLGLSIASQIEASLRTCCASCLS